jgi:hypothetical protein
MGVKPLKTLFPECLDQRGVDLLRIILVAAFLGGKVLDRPERIILEADLSQHLQRFDEVLFAAHGAWIILAD